MAGLRMAPHQRAIVDQRKAVLRDLADQWGVDLYDVRTVMALSFAAAFLHPHWQSDIGHPIGYDLAALTETADILDWWPNG